MYNLSCRFSCVVCVLFFSALCFSGPNESKPSVEEFVKHPRFENSKISPSGKYLALTRRNRDHQGILVLNLNTMKVESGTHFGKHEDVWDFFWANDERLLIEPALRLPATMSYKAPTGELIGMNADGTNLKRLSGFRIPEVRTGTLLYNRHPITDQGEVFDLYGHDEDHVLVQAGSSRSSGYTRAYLLNINNGRARLVGRSKTRYGSFIADDDGFPTINFGTNADNETEVYYREDSEEGFELLRRSRFGKGSVVPVAPVPDGSGYYVLENITADTRSLAIWQPDQGNNTLDVIFRHPRADVDSVVTGTHNQQLLAVKYHDPLPNYFYPDENLPIVIQHQRLRKEYPGRDVEIESVTEDLRRAVINITGDIYPSTYYLLNVDSGEMEKIFDSRPELQPADLATMQPVTIPSRDGLQLQGFLTLPKKAGDALTNLPLVVLVHGGPYGLRDHWGYDFEVQLLASRGYAVLQVNFRGSSGAGLKFQAAGIGQWGASMQDDLTDATHWAIGQGIADSERICIYGSSYGGYAALMGAVREPDLYRCAIGYGGVYDLRDLFDRGAIQASASGASYLDQVLGRDDSQLAARSPFYQAAKIKARVMIAHGRKDELAPYEQAANMREALIEAANEPEYFVERREGHGFFGQDSRVRYYNQLLEFLDDNIGAESLQEIIGWAELKQIVNQ